MITASQALYRARSLRGWSQATVASKLGTSRKTVSRWECGETFPSPYFRERLCLLFDLDIEALGLLQPFPKENFTEKLIPISSLHDEERLKSLY
jgi:transcriptional regulator with XRE-family HTH domain